MAGLYFRFVRRGEKEKMQLLKKARLVFLFSLSLPRNNTVQDETKRSLRPIHNSQKKCHNRKFKKGAKINATNADDK